MSIETQDEFALSTAWTAHKDFKKPFRHTLETSGQTVLLQRLDMPDLLKLGIANEMDFMSKALIIITKLNFKSLKHPTYHKLRYLSMLYSSKISELIHSPFLLSLL